MKYIISLFYGLKMGGINYHELFLNFDLHSPDFLNNSSIKIWGSFTMTTMENRFIELFMIRFNDGKHDWLEDDEWQKIVSEMEELENFIDKEKVSKKLKELFGLN